jgi:hypothetical protein
VKERVVADFPEPRRRRGIVLHRRFQTLQGLGGLVDPNQPVGAVDSDVHVVGVEAHNAVEMHLSQIGLPVVLTNVPHRLMPRGVVVIERQGRPRARFGSSEVAPALDPARMVRAGQLSSPRRRGQDMLPRAVCVWGPTLDLTEDDPNQERGRIDVREPCI